MVLIKTLFQLLKIKKMNEYISYQILGSILFSKFKTILNYSNVDDILEFSKTYECYFDKASLFNILDVDELVEYSEEDGNNLYLYILNRLKEEGLIEISKLDDGVYLNNCFKKNKFKDGEVVFHLSEDIIMR